MTNIRKYTAFLSLVLLLQYLFSTPALAVDTAEEETKEVKQELGMHPWKSEGYNDEQGGWSMFIAGGFNLFDGDARQTNYNLFSTHKWKPTLGLGVEYSFNSVWGLMASYHYIPYSLGSLRGNRGDNMVGTMHTGDLMATFDVIDVWAPERNHTLFSLYLMGGLGMGMYKSEIFAEDGSILQSTYTDEPKYSYSGAIPMGVRAEFNVSRAFSMGLTGQYRLYLKDDLDTPSNMRGAANDVLEVVTLNLRWKFASKKRNHNMNWAGPSLAERNRRKDTLVVKSEPRIDTVYVVEKVPVAPVVEEVAPSRPLYNAFEVVAFENNSATLGNEALFAIYKMAMALQEDSTLYVDIVGTCDNTGSAEYNEKLSQKRADAVKNELIRVYAIDSERIIARGRGMSKNVSGSYAANRRAEIRLVTKEEAEKIAAACTKTCAKEEVACESAVTDEVLATEVVQEGDRLYKFARRHYGAAIFWVYVYEANRDVMNNPDHIEVGMKLRIPKLPEEMVDANCPEAIEKADKLRAKYVV